MTYPYQSQMELRLIGEVRTASQAPISLVQALPSFRAALRYAVNQSGLDQCEVANALGIDPGEFSRMLRDAKRENSRQRELPHNKLAQFCRVTGSLAPLQWQALELGTELIEYRPANNVARIAELEAELQLRRSA